MWEHGVASLPETRRSQLAHFAQEKDTVSPTASVCPQPGHPMHGTCLHMFCFLGNDTLTHPVVSTDDVVLFDYEANGFYRGHDESKQGDVPGKGFVSTFYLCFCQKLVRTCSSQ